MELITIVASDSGVNSHVLRSSLTVSYLHVTVGVDDVTSVETRQFVDGCEVTRTAVVIYNVCVLMPRVHTAAATTAAATPVKQQQ